jgi:hypothetical protein
MNIKMEGQPGNMSVPALAARCLREINSYRRGETQDIPSCLELFHRARIQHDDVALEALRQCFREFVRDWIGRHPQKEVVCRFESEEYYTALAFERFWQEIIHRQVLGFGTLTAALAFLQASLNGVILETLRTYSRSSKVAFLETDDAGEQVVENDENGGTLWETIQRMLPNEREQRVAYLLFHCGLQPGEIVRGNPQEFSDVQEVARLRRNIIARLVRSGSNLLEQWKENTMAYNYYHSAKLAEAHRQDLLREAAQQRLVARLPRRRSLSRRVAHNLGIFLIKLGMWLKQQGEAVESDL